MKTSARFLAMLLAVLMIAGAALSVSAFSDVTGAVEHATAINVLAQLGVIGGYEDGTFKPEQNVTRAEMAKLVYVLYTTFTDAGAGAVKFDDVKADNWAAGYISWCASKNIIGGYGDGKFGPNDNVTYDQALKMVAGTLGYNDWDSAQWPTDVRMKALNDLKLGEDIPATVKGRDNLTRAQVAQIMYNALEADMNETKSEPVVIAGLTINMPVAKKLAVDVWKFEKVTYTVDSVATKNNKTEITLTWEKDEEKKSDTFELAELGLEAYEGKAKDLVNLQLVGLEKKVGDKFERLGNPSILGTIKDGVKVSFKDSRKNLTIDGVEYDAEDFEADAKHPIAITVDGKKVDVVFDTDDKLTDAVATKVMPNKQYLARAIDYEGDGYVDTVEIVAKVAYVVDDVKTTTKDGTTVTLKTLQANPDTLKVNAKNLSISVEEEDIIVAATLGETTYAEKVEATTTYATKLNKSDAKVTLNEVGEVKFDKLTIAGVDAISISTEDLGKDNTDVYYIYNGEVIKKDTVRNASDYAFAILRDVVELDAELNESTKEFTAGYTANIYVVEDGKLTLKKLPLDPADGEVLFDTYEVKQEVVNGKKLAKYTYALVTGYSENKDGYYELTIEDAVDESEEYIVVPAGSYIEYFADTEYYKVGDESKIRANENTVIFYTEEITEGTAKGFIDINFYTADTITKNSFDDVVTSGVTVLHKNDAGRLTLLATFVNGKIEGSVDDGVVSYKNDGSLILFAPEGSSIEIHDDKAYNSYIFMDNETLTVKDAEVDKNKEYDKTENKGTIAGGLYGYDAKNGNYVQITADNTPETIKATTLLDVIAEDEVIEYAGEKNVIKKISSDVTIWGLGKSNKETEIIKLTLEELDEMFELVEKYNEDNGKSEEISIFVISKIENINGTKKETIQSIIVEIYEADEDDEDIVTSVNTTIFDTFNK